MNEKQAIRVVRAAFDNEYMPPGPGFEPRMRDVLREPARHVRPRRWPFELAGVLAVVLVAALVLPRLWSLTRPAASDAFAPSALDVAVEITTPSSEGKVILVVDFSRAGKPVDLQRGDLIEWNGLVLTQQSGSVEPFKHTYSSGLALVPTTGEYELVYWHRGTETAIRVPVLAGPTVFAPRPGAVLDLKSGLTVKYAAMTGPGPVEADLTQTRIDADGGQVVTGVDGSALPDVGTYTLDDVARAGIKPGPCWFVFYKLAEISIEDTGFRSVNVKNAASTGFWITWR